MGGFTDERPTAYQEGKGQRTKVHAAYRLAAQKSAETWEYGFTVSDYDPRRELVIDPAIIVYAGYISA
jgi:hypothetical protein